MKSIRQLMSEYETMRLARDQLVNEWEQAKTETIPPEIRKILDEIDTKYQAMLVQIDEQLDVIEKTIRAHVITHREPVRGEWLQAVFSVRRTVGKHGIPTWRPSYERSSSKKNKCRFVRHGERRKPNERHDETRSPSR